MQLIELSPDDSAGVEAYLDVEHRANAIDFPFIPRRTAFRQEMEMRHGWDGEPDRFFLAQHEGIVVGSLNYLAPERDNPELAWLDFRVDPDHRGHGLGSAVLAEIEHLALSSGRPSVVIGGADADPTRRFAAKHGYVEASVGVQRVQQLDGSDAERARFHALRAEGEERSTDYDLVRITGRTPERYRESLVRATLAINDSPFDDLDYDGEFYDQQRVAEYEETQLRTGFRFRRVLAVERATGEVAGHTVVVVDSETPTLGEQHDTTVVPEHRGHRLGLRLKAEMSCWLSEDEPQLRSVHTGNAETNSWMIAINERLGYRVVGRRLLFQKRLG